VPDETAAESKESGAVRGAPSVRTFLIADIRGYTSFSHEHGDAAASQVARHFAEIVQDAIAPEEGELLELRGDEALCVFGSARDALRAAVELQVQFRRRVDGEPNLPLGVGIGLEAGEAVPMGDGYRGRALNVASRLCALAQPGEILATETVATLAGHQEGIGFASRRSARLKGIVEPLRYVHVVPEIELPPVPVPPRTEGRGHRKRLLVLVVAAAVLAAVATVLGVLLSREGSTASPVSVVPNSVAVIDPQTNAVVADVRVGSGPERIAVGEGKVWVLNVAAQTISLIDARDRSLVKTFGTAATPVDVAVGLGRVWLGLGATSSVLQLDPETAVVEGRIAAPPLTSPPIVGPERGDAGRIAISDGTVWFLSGNSTLSRMDAKTGEVLERIRYPGILGALFGEAWVAAGEGAVWVSAERKAQDYVTRVDPGTNSVVARIVVPQVGPIAVGLGGVWVATSSENGGPVWQINPRSDRLTGTVRCKGHALDVAVGETSLWVACSDGVVLRVDPVSGELVRTIRVGGIPAGIAVGEGAVWVSVD
jgi:YVTN family beta-propeller protein